MGISGLDHWVITAGDVERTLAFYRRLGFETVYEPRPGEPRGRPTIRISETQKINVHPPSATRNPGPGVAAHPTIGSADFCLVWEGTVQEALDHLKRCGVIPESGPVGRVCARGPATSVYFRDPDGNLVEFAVYTPSA